MDSKETKEKGSFLYKKGQVKRSIIIPNKTSLYIKKKDTNSSETLDIVCREM